MRVAIVHEWFSTFAGSEKVVEQLIQLYPQADLFALVDFMPPEDRAFLRGKPVRTSFIQNLPGARRNFRRYLPLMPLAVEQFDLSGYDLIISSNHAVAKGVITGPDQVHLSYVHSPIRYAWDMQAQYLRESGLDSGFKGAITRYMLHRVRSWDALAALRVDAFAANSAFIARRIEKFYRRSSTVIHPPVDVDRFALQAEKEDFYLTASRLVPYKRVPLIVKAFSALPGRRLVVIGDGVDMPRARAEAGPNVEFLGHQSDADLVRWMQRARAFVFAAEEDFGITPVEAQACGTPVIAFGRGGSLETVCGSGPAHTRTGIFFFEQSTESIVRAVREFESLTPSIGALTCRRHAERFSPGRFRESFEGWASAVLQSAGRGTDSRTRARPVDSTGIAENNP